MPAVLREARDGGQATGAGKPPTPRARRFAQSHGLVRRGVLTGAGRMLLASLEREEPDERDH